MIPKPKSGKPASGGFPTKKHAALIAAAVLILGAGVWGVTASRKPAKPVVTVPKELSVEALKTEDPHKVFEKLHDTMRDGKLTDEQRHKVFENMREAMEARMDKRVDEWMQANAVQKQVMIDKDLDEMQARMKEWQQRRAEHQATQPSGGSGGRGFGRPGPGPGSGPGNQAAGGGGGPGNQAGGGGGGPGGRGGRQGGPSRQERKERFESRNPDQTAKRVAYFTAMQNRAQQRGIQMPFGGGPGGPGGH
jgi:hypothetical protein